MIRILAICAALIMAFPTFADKLPLNDVSRYLNGLRTAQGQFTQVNEDGTISTGEIFIKRPGKARFEYNPPEGTLVVVGQGEVVVVDTKSNQNPEIYPLRRTPLSIILADNVNLSQARMVTDHGFDGTATTVTAQDPENPEYGSIKMLFTSNPVELRQWEIRNGNGSVTTVILGALKTGGVLRNRLFNTRNVAGITSDQ